MKSKFVYFAIYGLNSRYKLIVGLGSDPTEDDAIINIRQIFKSDFRNDGMYCRNYNGITSCLMIQWRTFQSDYNYISNLNLPESIEGLMVHPDVLFIDSKYNIVTETDKIMKYFQ